MQNLIEKIRLATEGTGKAPLGKLFSVIASDSELKEALGHDIPSAARCDVEDLRRSLNETLFLLACISLSNNEGDSDITMEEIQTCGLF